MDKTNKYDSQHWRNQTTYERQVDAIYRAAAKEAAALGVSIKDFNPDRLFSFSDYPTTRKKIEKLLSDLQADIETIIVNGIRSEWTLANNKNNELARQVFGDNVGKLTKEQERRYFSTNSAARDAFITRKTNGLGLSDRVWKYTEQFKEEIELGLDIGIRNGRSADELSRDLRNYLQHPDNAHFSTHRRAPRMQREETLFRIKHHSLSNGYAINTLLKTSPKVFPANIVGNCGELCTFTPVYYNKVKRLWKYVL